MSETTLQPPGADSIGARALIDRARDAESRTERALLAAIDDLFLPDDARLDDRTRAALGSLIEALVGAVEIEIRDYAVRVVRARDGAGIAQALERGGGPSLVDRLARAGLIRDPNFIGECLARVRLELASEALQPQAPGRPETPSLIVRLARSSDRVVAQAAAAVLAAESMRQADREGGPPKGTGLPIELHQRLVWWVTAAVRERAAHNESDHAALDRALAEAAMRNLAAHDETHRLESAVMRLASAIAPDADELTPLILEAVRDRRLALLTALLADALGAPYELLRELVLDPGGERLWLVLRALELPRDAVAEIGYRLSEADARRDVEVFADALGAIASVEPEAARIAVAPLRLHPDYRAALRALGAAEDRR
jgi:hypothetical protein